MARAESMKAE
jgi:hypothetical protein